MIRVQCSCGFAELDDEEMIDHLLLVFGADDGTGNDGRVHEELDRLTCSCGFEASTSQQLDTHFLKLFAPDDVIGRDGKKHEVRNAA